MHKKNLLILDTSFKSSFCYPTEKNPDIKKHFDTFIVNIKKELNGFEGDYEFIETPFSFLEYIGCRKLLAAFSEGKKKELESCFLSSEGVSDAMKNAQNDEQCLDILDDCVSQSYHRLVKFFMDNIDPILLILEANKKLNRKSVHENVIEIESCLHDWINCLSNNGRDSLGFSLLCVHLAWNTMLRYKWCEDKTINSNFLHRLIAFYADPEQFEYNLPGSVLFSALKGQIPFKEEELLDPSLIDLACRGYFNIDLNKWFPVIVLSTDMQQKERLKNYITGVQYANARLGRKAIAFTPGYFVLIRRSGSGENIEVIDIAQMIEDMH